MIRFIAGHWHLTHNAWTHQTVHPEPSCNVAPEC
jgi:hypothetical protein